MEWLKMLAKGFDRAGERCRNLALELESATVFSNEEAVGIAASGIDAVFQELKRNNAIAKFAIETGETGSS